MTDFLPVIIAVAVSAVLLATGNMFGVVIGTLIGATFGYAFGMLTISNLIFFLGMLILGSLMGFFLAPKTR